MRVVIADDDLIVRHILSSVLQSSDPSIEIVQCTSGEECLESFRASAADLLFLDIQLPDLSGPDVLTTLRTLPNGASVRVIAVSANPEAEMRELFVRTVPDGFLEKPFTPAQVLAVLAGEG